MDIDDLTPQRDATLRDDVAQTITVGLQFVVLAAVTLATARPFLFPSLGPSAYLLAAGEGEKEAQSGAYHVIGGHLVAVVSGLIGYHLFASGQLVIEALQSPAFSEPILRLGASSILGMMLTTIGMLVTDTNHPAAAATTLIVSLGILSTLREAAVIMLAVILLVVVHEQVIYPATIKFGFEPEDPRDV